MFLKQQLEFSHKKFSNCKKIRKFIVKYFKKVILLNNAFSSRNVGFLKKIEIFQLRKNAIFLQHAFFCIKRILNKTRGRRIISRWQLGVFFQLLPAISFNSFTGVKFEDAKF